MSTTDHKGSLLITAALGAALGVAVPSAAGCWRQDANYCPGAVHDNCLNVDAPISHCTSNLQCGASAAVCDVDGSRLCVQCTASEPAACTAGAPVCGADNMCHGCTAHAQCSSSACLPDGSCGSDVSVAYVDPAGIDNTSCSQSTPCKQVMRALATGRPYVKFHGTTDEAVTIGGGRQVTFLADPDAKLTRGNGNGAIVNVQGDGTSLRIYDLAISDAPNSPGGIGCVIPTASGAPTLALTRVKVTNNPGGGISVSGGSLTVTQSTISGNQGGGISISNGPFVVVGNTFFNNGGIMSLVGGISIGTTANPANRLEFNSFNQNMTQTTIGPAIHCVGAFTARNNVMSDNGTLTQMEQVGGSCSHAYSIARPGTMMPGTGNSVADPLFVNPAMGDLHIQSRSPARRAADPSSDLAGVAARDIDGDLRASPAAIGADEVP